MASNHKPSDKQANNSKNIRKVNLNDLQGMLSKRGRERYANPELLEAFREALTDGESFIWEEAVVTGKNDKEVTASKAKWRSRAISVFTSMNIATHKVTIGWTKDNEMVVTVLAKQD